MSPQILLAQKIGKYFKLHPSREETFIAMIFSAIASGNVHQSDLARYVGSPNHRSGLRRVERFFSQVSLDSKQYAQALVELFGFHGKFDLCLDRSNWKFGQTHINYLVLSWRLCKKVSLPLLFVNLDKAGNSNTQERIDLLHMFHELFGFHRIRCLTADREFVGQDWFQMLILNKIPFTIRAKENTALPWGRHQKIKAQRLFAHLKTGEYRRVEKEMFGGTVYFAGTRNAEGELVIVMTNVNVQAIKAFETYRKRWSIEELFRKLKTSGFHWENTHMTSPSRLDTLLIILCFGLTIGYLAGLKVKIPWKRTVNAALYSVFKQGLKELQFWLARGLEKTMALVAELFKNPCKSLFSKSDG